MQMLQQFKSEITRLQYPHSKRYEEDVVRAYGQDSTMAKDAKIWAAKIAMTFAGHAKVLEEVSIFYARNKGKAEVRNFEKKLLEWAKTFVS
jgi:hypothetical protein